MAVAGLVVTFAEDPLERAEAEARLAGDRRIETGPTEGPRQALVADTEDVRAGEALCESLRELPGIVAVDVAFVGDLDCAPQSEENER